MDKMSKEKSWWYSEKELIIRLNIIANKLRSEPEKIVRKDGSDVIRINGVGKAIMALTYCLKQLHNNGKMIDIQVEELYGAVMRYWNE